MERILERYERCSYAERQLKEPDLESPVSWTLEHAKLKGRVEVLQRNQRWVIINSYILNQLMNESISELQKKDKALQEQNNILAKKSLFVVKFSILVIMYIQIKEREKEMAASAAAATTAAMEQQQNHDLNSSGFGQSQHMGTLNIR
ncbi:hypothetical protein SASPL_149568 [Salvia splendens]|uniref:Uncharacterized protein n=1 Tax=Salvia splendens TaxID=180675 RepID=A0A8X8WBE4_SALSN|nr:hypothetical protein SASPL_149568 [Salvia splendens]